MQADFLKKTHKTVKSLHFHPPICLRGELGGVPHAGLLSKEHGLSATTCLLEFRTGTI